MDAKLRRLMQRTEQLGATDAVVELVGAYLKGAEQAADDFEAFHWGEQPDGTELVRMSQPPAVIWQLGELVEVVYEATKGGELAEWQHAFKGKRPILAFGRQPKGRGALHIVGGTYRVTERGIVG